jgi:hypothetical protein
MMKEREREEEDRKEGGAALAPRALIYRSPHDEPVSLADHAGEQAV